MHINLQVFEIESIVQFLYALELEPKLSRKRSQLIRTLTQTLSEKTNHIKESSQEQQEEIFNQHCLIETECLDELYAHLASYPGILSGDGAWAYDRLMEFIEENHNAKEEKPTCTTSSSMTK